MRTICVVCLKEKGHARDCVLFASKKKDMLTFALSTHCMCHLQARDRFAHPNEQALLHPTLWDRIVWEFSFANLHATTAERGRMGVVSANWNLA